MGWSFRKSINIGPLRINLSRSGIGLSAGLKGARVSVGPKGAQIRMGKDGVYYQKTLSDNHETEDRDEKAITTRRKYCQQCGKNLGRGTFCQYCGTNIHALEDGQDHTEAIAAPNPKEESALKKLFKRFLMLLVLAFALWATLLIP